MKTFIKAVASLNSWISCSFAITALSLLLQIACGGGGTSSPQPPTQAATPTFSVASGTYSSGQSVTLSCATSGAIIYYTTDGSIPTSSSTRYTSAVTVSASTTLKAFATASGYTDSAVAIATYTLKVAAPAITPAAGSYTTTQSVTISTTTPGASIHYTTDGTSPTASSTSYTAGITVSSNATVKAIATKSGYSNSDVASSTYTITANSGTPSYTFKNVKIVGGGFVTGISFHPTQRNLIYARTDVGGAYRWDNTNQTWVSVLDWLGFDQGAANGVEAIGLDPSDPQRLYIAGGIYSKDWQGNPINGNMLVSTDQGNTFQVVSVPIPLGGNEDGRSSGNRFAVDPNYGQKLYYGSKSTGLWTSNDHGSTWSKVTSFPVTGATNGNGIPFVEFVKNSGSAGTPTPVIYAGVADTTGSYSVLYRSTDAGTTWNAVPNQPSALASLFPNHGAFGPDGSLYMSFGNGIGPNGMSGGAVFKYTPTSGDPNAGTWTDISPPSSFPENGYGTMPAWGSVAVDAQRPGVIMASTMDLWWYHDAILRSTDGGQTWIDVTQTAVQDFSPAPFWSQGSPYNWMNLAIDPFNSDHVLYGFGGGIWASNDVTASEPGAADGSFQVLKGGTTHWAVGADGIEEVATIKLISPPAGPAHLISALGDVKGFVHTDLTKSPAGGAEAPYWGSSRGLDYAEAAPLVIVRTGDSDRMPWGSYSTDGGTTWTGFSAAPTSSAGGTIAVSSDGSTFVWSAQIVDSNWNVIGGKVAYSRDHGATWTASTGVPVNKEVFSDRVNKNKFYILDVSTTTLYRSTDGGATFAAVNTTVPTSSWYWPTMTVSYAAEGDLWLASDTGLYHSTDSGTTFTKISAVQVAYYVGFGMAAPGQTYPAVYLSGEINNLKALYRSVDAGATWIRINDDQHQYGGIGCVTGDPRIFGRVYFAGRGVMYGDSPY